MTLRPATNSPLLILQLFYQLHYTNSKNSIFLFFIFTLKYVIDFYYKLSLRMCESQVDCHQFRVVSRWIHFFFFYPQAMRNNFKCPPTLIVLNYYCNTQLLLRNCVRLLYTHQVSCKKNSVIQVCQNYDCTKQNSCSIPVQRPALTLSKS